MSNILRLNKLLLHFAPRNYIQIITFKIDILLRSFVWRRHHSPYLMPHRVNSTIIRSPLYFHSVTFRKSQSSVPR